MIRSTSFNVTFYPLGNQLYIRIVKKWRKKGLLLNSKNHLKINFKLEKHHKMFCFYLLLLDNICFLWHRLKASFRIGSKNWCLHIKHWNCPYFGILKKQILNLHWEIPLHIDLHFFFFFLDSSGWYPTNKSILGKKVKPNYWDLI